MMRCGSTVKIKWRMTHADCERSGLNSPKNAREQASTHRPL